MRCVCVFVLNCNMRLFFVFVFLFGVKVYYLSSGGTIPTNHPGSVAVI